MSDLRVVGLRFEVDVGDGKTKIVQMRRAISDTTATVDALNRELGDNVKISTEKVQTDKEVIAQARLIVSQQERQRRKTEQVVQQYTRLNQTIKQYGNDAETVNAIVRLGSDATEQQKQEVAQLVQEYQRLRNAGDTAGSGFRNLRGVAQNLGWQLQDVAVQAQMGTSWLVILGQQGSQFAAAFGHWGALIGAGIAVIAAGMPALITYLSDATTSTDELKEAQERLNRIFNQSSLQVNGFSSELVELFEIDRRLAELKLTSSLFETDRQIIETKKQISELSESYLGMAKAVGGGSKFLNFDRAAKGLGVTQEQFKTLREEFLLMKDSKDPSGLVQALDNIRKSGTKLTPDMNTLVNDFVDLSVKLKLNEDQLAKLNKVLLENGEVTTGEHVESLAEKYDRLRAQLYMTDRQIEIDNFLRFESVKLKEKDRDVTRLALENYLNERDVIEARNKAIEESKRLDEERIKQRNNLLSPIEQSLTVSSDNPVIAEIERNKQTMDTLQTQLQATKEYEYSERARINDLIEREEQRHVDALFDAQLTLASNQVAIIGSVSDFMSGMADEFATGADRVREQMEEMTAFQKVMFFIQRSIAAAEAVINGISLGAKLAEMFPLAAIPMQTFGTTMGAVNAGAIMGTTFAGAFDNGGYIPSGMTGIVSEYGDELVNGVMVRGPADVTSRVDTAAMMSGGLNVTVENYAPGVTHEVQQIDENTVKIIATKVFNENIDRGVSGVLGKKGTKSNKALTTNYDVRGRV